MKDERIRLIEERLQKLQQEQMRFAKEIQQVRNELYLIKNNEKTKASPEEEENIPTASVEKPSINESYQNYTESNRNKEKFVFESEAKKPKSNLERYIGENLINKIGIIITIIGIGIGVKYSIEHDLIRPLTRIILAYLAGFGLLGLGLWLKKKYLNYSAVLVSGSMAVLYFTSYSAYAFYDLFSRIPSFAIMILITGVCVYLALNYKKQVIASIGLVGAYAIPFLLAGNKGIAVVLFSYIGIINIGILSIAIYKYWKTLHYLSFGFTWLIYLAWYIRSSFLNADMDYAFVILLVYFLVFYTTFLIHKVIHQEKFIKGDIVLLLSNSFLFYALGLHYFHFEEFGEYAAGIFSISNALIHGVVGFLIHQRKIADRNLLYLVLGLVFVFITISIPVQLDGAWVSILWLSEAALLFWIGRKQTGALIYERLSYPLLILSALSLMQDWDSAYGIANKAFITDYTFIWNKEFLSSFICVGILAFMNFVRLRHSSKEAVKLRLYPVMEYIFPLFFLVSTYMLFRLEIEQYWYQQASNYAGQMKSIWIHIYSLAYISTLSFLALRLKKAANIIPVLWWVSVGAVILFLSQGLFRISELRELYLEAQANLSNYLIWIRYIALCFLAIFLYLFHTLNKESKFKNEPVFQNFYTLLIHTTGIWILSSELIHWLDMYQSSSTYKLGLSILWGIYALYMIAIGIWKHHKTTRIVAISLFGITLMKLFFYDIAHLSTINKTIVLISLGVLLLGVSFLYNKYKSLLFPEDISSSEET